MPLWVAGFIFLCVLYGHIFERLTGVFFPNRVGIAYQLLTGFLTFNTLLFVLTLASPFGMRLNIAALGVLGLVGFATASRFPHAVNPPPADELPGFICIFLTGAAATLWVSEMQPAMNIQGSAAVFRAWPDIFIHVREISIFAQLNGLGSMSDIRMAGAPALPYHYASYVSAAAFSSLVPTTAVAAFGGFQLPFGILLAGVAAFVLIGSLWGLWHGVAAAVAIVALPDAYQQGFGSPYLGFHFMSQVNLGMLYGLACSALAWLFMIEGCRRASYRAVMVAYVFLAICLLYKAHLFVANAFLLLIFPCIFFAGLRLRWRVVLGVCFTALFIAIVQASQQYPVVPTIRLDGSGIAIYLRLLLDTFDPGPVYEALESILFEHHYPKIVDLTVITPLLLFCSFGIWVFISPLVFWKIRKALPQDLLVLPILVVANYLVMAIGLATQKGLIGNPEELLNRPSAWAYFIVVTFTVAGICSLLARRKTRFSRLDRLTLAGLAGLVLFGVNYYSKNFQTMPLTKYRNYADFNAFPLCHVRAAEFIRDHARVHDVMADSRSDPQLISTAISERQVYASAFVGLKGRLKQRIETFNAIQDAGDVTALRALAIRDHIGWYLIRPFDVFRWPAGFIANSEYSCGGYHVIRLSP